MLEVEPSDPVSSQNGNEVVASTISEAFSGWLHHQYASIKLRPQGGVYRFDMQYFVLCYEVVLH